MDLKKTKPSKNVEDQTGYTPLQRGLDTLLTKLNPVYAYRNTRDAIKYGAPRSTQHIDIQKAPESKNFVDRTGETGDGVDWNHQLGMRAFEEQGIPFNEATKGLSPEDLQAVLFQKVLEEFGGFFMNKWPEPRRIQGPSDLLKRR